MMLIRGTPLLARCPLSRNAHTCTPLESRCGKTPRRPHHTSSVSSLGDNTAGIVAVSDNLGQLGRFAAQGQPTTDDDALMLQRVDPSSFSEQGLYVDGSSIFASSVLLLVLVAFSTNRIFGLDRFLVSAARSWREKKRTEELVKLQRMMGDDNDSDVRDPSGGSPSGEAR